MTEQEPPSKRHVFARDLLMPLIVGAVGVIGSLSGVLIGNASNARQAERQQQVAFQTRILDQRLALIDRAARIFGKSPGLQDVWGLYLKATGAAHDGTAPELPMALLDKLTEAQGEFQSVLFLSQVYFGPKTRAAIKDLSSTDGPWWQKPKPKQDAFIAAMVSEATLGVDAVPSLGSSAP